MLTNECGILWDVSLKFNETHNCKNTFCKCVQRSKSNDHNDQCCFCLFCLFCLFQCHFICLPSCDKSMTVHYCLTYGIKSLKMVCIINKVFQKYILLTSAPTNKSRMCLLPTLSLYPAWPVYSSYTAEPGTFQFMGRQCQAREVSLNHNMYFLHRMGWINKRLRL